MTGVQTCALPISGGLLATAIKSIVVQNLCVEIIAGISLTLGVGSQEIGRASCRERVYISGVAGSLKKKKTKQKKPKTKSRRYETESQLTEKTINIG